MNNFFSDKEHKLNKPTENMINLIREVKALSDHIAALKHKANAMEPGPELDKLRKDIRRRRK